jgi:hypothetical protein
MTKSFAFLALLGVLSLGCETGTDGNGERADEIRDVSAFVKVRSDAELDVEIVQGDQHSVTLSLDSNLLPMVRTRVDNETLYIDTRESIGETVRGPHVLITVPALSAAKLSGSGDLFVGLDQAELALDLYLSGSGDVRFVGRAAALGAFVSGSGDVRLEGETSDVELSLSGSGDIDARELSAESGSVELDGSGDISASISESAAVSLSGSGDIDLYGGGEVSVDDRSGSGDIDVH